jgi:hypothetical protein
MEPAEAEAGKAEVCTLAGLVGAGPLPELGTT